MEMAGREGFPEMVPAVAVSFSLAALLCNQGSHICVKPQVVSLVGIGAEVVLPAATQLCCWSLLYRNARTGIQ